MLRRHHRRNFTHDHLPTESAAERWTWNATQLAVRDWKAHTEPRNSVCPLTVVRTTPTARIGHCLRFQNAPDRMHKFWTRAASLKPTQTHEGRSQPHICLLIHLHSCMTHLTAISKDHVIYRVYHRSQVTLVARPLLTPVAQNLCRPKHGVHATRRCVPSWTLLRIEIVSCCSWSI
jgi:hypothetical protein